MNLNYKVQRNFIVIHIKQIRSQSESFQAKFPIDRPHTIFTCCTKLSNPKSSQQKEYRAKRKSISKHIPIYQSLFNSFINILWLNSS